MHDPQRQSPEASLVEALREALAELRREYEALESLADRRRDAVSRADLKAISECIGSENEVVQRIASAEQRRREAASALSERFGLEDAESAPVSRLAEHLDEHERADLLAAADDLRSVIRRVQQKNSAARRAAETLARHMQGLLRAAEHWFSHAGTYGKQGTVGAGTAVCSVMDVTT